MAALLVVTLGVAPANAGEQPQAEAQQNSSASGDTIPKKDEDKGAEGKTTPRQRHAMPGKGEKGPPSRVGQDRFPHAPLSQSNNETIVPIQRAQTPEKVDKVAGSLDDTEEILRDLEFLMLLELLRDYDLFDAAQ